MKNGNRPGQENPAYHVRLGPETRGFHTGVGEVWRYRDLVLLLAKKQFTMTYQQTVLGPLWILLQPAVASLVHMLVFGYIAQIGTGGVPQILFYFTSSAIWELFASSLTSNAETFVSNAHLFSKVYFPRLAVPFSNMLVSLLKFAVQLVIIFPLLLFFLVRGDVHPMPALLPLIPLLLLQLTVMGMSIGVLLSSLTTKYRDLMHLVAVGVNLLMYGSAVAYSLSSVPQGTVRSVIMLNPLTQSMELIRMILLGEGEFSFPCYLAGLLLTALLFMLGTAVFNRVEKTFEDTI